MAVCDTPCCPVTLSNTHTLSLSFCYSVSVDRWYEAGELSLVSERCTDAHSPIILTETSTHSASDKRSMRVTRMYDTHREIDWERERGACSERYHRIYAAASVVRHSKSKNHSVRQIDSIATEDGKCLCPLTHMLKEDKKKNDVYLNRSSDQCLLLLLFLFFCCSFVRYIDG